LRIKRLTETAKMPKRANPDDSGLDLYADLNHPVMVGVGGRARIPTGLAMAVPSGWEMQVRPRSGLTTNHGVVVMLGTVDSTYRGEVVVTLINFGREAYSVQPGDKVAQLVIARVELWTPMEVAQLDDTTRGANGFGSTGR